MALAGDDVTVQLPKDSVTLDGSLSTDDKGIVAYQWVQLPGDNRVRLGKDTESKLELRGLTAGNYYFSLTVYDELGQYDEDSVFVRVLGKTVVLCFS